MTILLDLFNAGKLTEAQYEAGARYVKLWKAGQSENPQMRAIYTRLSVLALEFDRPGLFDAVHIILLRDSPYDTLTDYLPEALDIMIEEFSNIFYF